MADTTKTVNGFFIDFFIDLAPLEIAGRFLYNGNTFYTYQWDYVVYAFCGVGIVQQLTEDAIKKPIDKENGRNKVEKA